MISLENRFSEVAIQIRKAQYLFYRSNLCVLVKLTKTFNMYVILLILHESMPQGMHTT